MSKVRFALVLHDHQPIGNFDGVIEEAYRDSYRAFLEVIESRPLIRFSLHHSGCLLEWLAVRHPDYIDRLKALVARGQLEILGGGFHEPILTMIPARDRVGQIKSYSEYLSKMFQTPIRGMWVPERVWEQNLVTDIVRAGIEYTVLDDFHFRKAGLAGDQLHGYYLSEESGKLLKIFPGSEPLRYFIPFQDVGQTIDYLRDLGQRFVNPVAVFADDGEKFGTWPETKKHVYENGWIHRFLDALEANADWLETVTLASAADTSPPVGKVYLPDGSYREMTEWALPADRLVSYEHLWHSLDHRQDGNFIREFLKGGYWRNFKIKYPETNEMYARMMGISESIDRMSKDPRVACESELQEARAELYRGQCNCAYWHGAFGGIYLPHLRNAVFEHLIKAENHLLNCRPTDTSMMDPTSTGFCHVSTGDFNFDGKDEILLENEHIATFFSPASGGNLYEFDVRSKSINIAGSLNRRPEAYHEKIRSAGDHSHGGVGSIHDRVVFKQPGLDRKLQYDRYPRKWFIDHILSCDTTPQQIEEASANELVNFYSQGYKGSVVQLDGKAELVLRRYGLIGQNEIELSKTFTLNKGTAGLSAKYQMKGLPANRPFLLAVECNVAALASNANDRYFRGPAGNRLGTLGHRHVWNDLPQISLVDDWLQVAVEFQTSPSSNIWTFPLETVNQSEGGFELVHQATTVLLVWVIKGDSGSWEGRIDVSIGGAGR